MPTQYLDSKIAINSVGGTAVTTTPNVFATLGLNTVNAGPDLEIQFSASISILIDYVPEANITVTVTINRISSLGTVPVYMVTQGFLNRMSFITVAGADYQPPNPDGFLIYQAVVSAANFDANPISVGPESLIAAAYSQPLV